MVTILVILLFLALGFFILLLMADAKKTKEEISSPEEKEKNPDTPTGGEIQKSRRRCFETYQQYQVEEQKYQLYRKVLCTSSGESGVLHFLQALFSFYRESLDRKWKGTEYKARILDGILTPMREHIHKSFPYQASGYQVPNRFDLFLTPEEYYEQQASYLEKGFESKAAELSFWRGRLSRNEENIKKLQIDSGNAFLLKLWLSLAPLLLDAETRYREAINQAPGREQANQLTKELMEGFEEALFRAGIILLWYEDANANEKKTAFVPSRESKAPALVREKDGLVYEKGRYPV